MSIVIRAEDEPVATRLDYVRHAVGDTIVPFDLRVDAEPDFSSQVVADAAGTLQMATVTGPPMEAARTPLLIRRSDPELFKIDVQTRGHSVFEQDGREAVLRPGDVTFVNLSRPCHLTTTGYPEQEIVAVKFPRTLLPIPERELTRLTAVRIGGSNGLGPLVASLVVHMRDHADDYTSSDRARLATALTDLIAVGLAGPLDRRSLIPWDSHRRVLLMRIRAFIDHRLGDPALSPAVVAAGNHISVRYLHKLFETEGTSVARWIRARRLELCCRDLLDPTLQTVPVRAIGARWGLVDAQHFSRVFRAVYGLPPAEYREAHRGPSDETLDPGG
ncbi:MAG: helix-turn-helix domain-containing protein [Acidimicrobiales bacterium]